MIENFLNKIICCNSFRAVKTLPDNSVDLVLTSPPYFQQRDYGDGENGFGSENTVDAYLENLLEIFGECARVVRETGSIVFNLGDKYQNQSLLLVPFRFAIAAQERFPGLKLANSITWIKTNPTPRQFKRRLVSSTEPFFHFVKSNNYKYFPDQFCAHAETKKPVSRPGDRVGKKYFALIEESTLSEDQKLRARTSLSEVIAETRAGSISGFRMKIKGIHAEPFGGQEGGRKNQIETNGFTVIRLYGNPLKKDVIVSPVDSIKNSPHRATFPASVVDEILNLLTEPNDVVFDPFAGSGTTGERAFIKNRNFIAFDLNSEFCSFAERRIEQARANNLLPWRC